jgi:hypothetical protein
LRDTDLHDEIERIEEEIERLADKIKSCRKLVLVSRIATWSGGAVLAAIVLGENRFDPGVMAAAVAALLGGIVAWSSNISTAEEATKELAGAEADRAVLIEMIHPRAIR